MQELTNPLLGVPLRRNTTILSNRLNPNTTDTAKKYDLGFPGFLTLSRKAIRAVAPRVYQKLERKLTIPYTRTIEGNDVPWLSPNAAIVLGRNSDFHVETLPDELVEQIGGIEYVALRWLSYMVPLVSFFPLPSLVQHILIAFVVLCWHTALFICPLRALAICHTRV